MHDFLEKVRELLDNYNILYELIGENSSAPWIVYPSITNRLWEIDFNISKLYYNHEVNIAIKTNPNHWDNLTAWFEPLDSDYYIDTMTEFKQHFEEIVIATNAYNLLYPSKNT